MKVTIKSKVILSSLFFLAISGFAYTTSAFAEIVYVSDNLRVGVRPKPDSSIAPINVVTSGMHLTVITSEAGYIKISTETGITGWVKEVYMTKETPVREKFDTLKIKYEKQDTLIQGLKQSIETLSSIKTALITDLDTIRSEKSDVELKLARIVEQKYVDNLGNKQEYLIIIAIILFISAFFIGMFWYRYLVTRRLGGLRL